MHNNPPSIIQQWGMYSKEVAGKGSYFNNKTQQTIKYVQDTLLATKMRLQDTKLSFFLQNYSYQVHVHVHVHVFVNFKYITLPAGLSLPLSVLLAPRAPSQTCVYQEEPVWR